MRAADASRPAGAVSCRPGVAFEFSCGRVSTAPLLARPASPTQNLLDAWLSLWQWVFQPAIGVLMLGAVRHSTLQCSCVLPLGNFTVRARAGRGETS